MPEPTPQEAVQRSYRWHKEALTRIDLDGESDLHRAAINAQIASLEAGLWHYARRSPEEEAK